MKIKINWKELGKQLWNAVKPALLGAIGGGLVAVTGSGCSALTPSAKTQTMSLYAIGIPGVARPLAVTSLRSCAQSLCSLRGFPPKRSFFGTCGHALHAGRGQQGRRREQADAGEPRQRGCAD